MTSSIHSKFGASLQRQKNIRRNIQYPDQGSKLQNLKESSEFLTKTITAQLQQNYEYDIGKKPASNLNRSIASTENET